MNEVEKVAGIVERLRELEVLSEPKPFAQQLQDWNGSDVWITDVTAELTELIEMIDALLVETQDGD